MRDAVSNVITDEEIPMVPLELELDIAKAKKLRPEEARFVVDQYYRIQKARIQAANRVRALTEGGEPANIMSWMQGQFVGMEQRLQRALRTWVKESPVGRWSLEVIGIGPVLAAGLMAHIDLARTPSPSALWRFAGLDPTLEWHGSEAGRDLVKAAVNAADDDTWKALTLLADMTKRRPSTFTKVLGLEEPSEEEAWKRVAGLQEYSAKYPLHLDNAVRHFAADQGVALEQIYRLIYPDLDKAWEVVPLGKFLAKKPWNGALKVLCWKIGRSFVMFNNKEGSLYGRLYRERKGLEVEKNEGGLFKDTAEQTLKAKRFGKDTMARAAYEVGKLPAGRLDLRASRYAVKVFLFHWYCASFAVRYPGKPLPRPWVIEFGGHSKEIPPEVPYPQA